ncbi:MAG: hypothetical protein IPJ65_21735 [Archangiaceae bacterium]|nr:hypothetical protein [Archangiaceae bacterium]
MRSSPVVTVALLASLAACGPGRDPTFKHIIELSAVTKLQLGDKSVYFVEAQALKRVAKKGGDAEVILASGVVDFAATNGHVFAATTSGIVHLAVASDGALSAPTTVSSAPALAIAADGNGVSWASCSALTHAALDGSAQRSVSLSGGCAGATVHLTLDSSTAYGVDSRGEWYASRSGSAAKHFATETCSSIEAAGGWLYCGDAARGLRRIYPFGGTVEVLFPGTVRAFDISDAKVYASVGQDLVSSPRNTARYEVIGTYATISAIAVDTDALFFVNTTQDRGLMLSTAL